MAHNNIEVEIKIRIDPNLFLIIKEKIKQIAKFAKKTLQVDEYYTPQHKNFVEPNYPFEWLSIRKRGEKSFLNYKHFYPENVEITSHCDEFEALIDKPEQIEKIFSKLNFKKLITVEKDREAYVCKDEFEIALDTVKDLGFFMEIEALKDLGGIDQTRKKLISFAEELGVDATNTEKRGYPYLLMKKKGLIK